MKRKGNLLFCLLLLVTCNAAAQIQGKVLDKTQKSLEFVTVVLKKATDSSFVAYIRTDANGFYAVQPKSNDSFLLSFSALGYAKQEQVVSVSDTKATLTINAILQEEAFSLDEVIVSVQAPITQKKDAIIFDVKALL